MSFTKQKLNDLNRGDSRVYKFTFNDGATPPVVIDITNWTIWMTFKSDLSVADGAAGLQVRSTSGDNPADDPPNGIMYLELTSDITEKLVPGVYQYDCQLVKEGTTPLDVSTLSVGKVKILEDVTISTAVISAPDAFTFDDLVDVATSTGMISNIITVLGINISTAITISGDASSEYSINGGDYTNSPGVVKYGDQIRVKHTSSALASTQVDSIVTIGGVSDTFSTVTVA